MPIKQLIWLLPVLILFSVRNFEHLSRTTTTRLTGGTVYSLQGCVGYLIYSCLLWGDHTAKEDPCYMVLQASWITGSHRDYKSELVTQNFGAVSHR